MIVQVGVVVKRSSITSAEVIITVEVNCVSSVGGIKSDQMCHLSAGANMTRSP